MNCYIFLNKFIAHKMIKLLENVNAYYNLEKLKKSNNK